MRRFILILIIAYLSLCNVQAQIITGEVQYNAKSAEEQVMRTPIKKPSQDFLYSKYIDTNNTVNLEALKNGITELENRKMVLFSDGSYGVVYLEDPLYSWYYSNNGRLINFMQKESELFPTVFVKFKPDGSVANRGIKVSENESFIFSPEGKLIAHWMNTICYDKDNNIIMTRKIVE